MQVILIIKLWINIMATYKEILKSLLEAVAENPNSNIDELLTKKALEYGLSKKEIEELSSANSLIDKFESKNQELVEARKNGMTRESFLYGEINNLTDGKEDKEKEIILTAIKDAAENIDGNKE